MELGGHLRGEGRLFLKGTKIECSRTQAEEAGLNDGRNWSGKEI